MVFARILEIFFTRIVLDILEAIKTFPNIFYFISIEVVFMVAYSEDKGGSRWLIRGSA